MTIWFANGTKGTVEDISNEGLDEPVAVYNFRVEDFHTYFVGDSGVLVHNNCNGTTSTTQNDTSPNNGKKTVEVNGKTVTMDNSTFDPNYVDSKGRSNLQRMEQGLAPIGTDGKSVHIHHVDQTNNGPVVEITATQHQQNYSFLHSNTGQAPSKIDRNEFNSWRSSYWKWRSGNSGV